jgi:hypothetical protein
MQLLGAVRKVLVWVLDDFNLRYRMVDQRVDVEDVYARQLLLLCLWSNF